MHVSSDGHAVLLGVLYYRQTLSGIGAVQNRMGIFMLECMFIAFTSVSALPVSRTQPSHTLTVHVHCLHLRLRAARESRHSHQTQPITLN